jgi:hypothetical protein
VRAAFSGRQFRAADRIPDQVSRLPALQDQAGEQRRIRAVEVRAQANSLERGMIEPNKVSLITAFSLTEDEARDRSNLRNRHTVTEWGRGWRCHRDGICMGTVYSWDDAKAWLAGKDIELAT